MKKKIISLLLAFAMVLNMLPLNFAMFNETAEASTIMSSENYKVQYLEYPLLTAANKSLLSGGAASSPLNYAYNMHSWANYKTTFFTCGGDEYLTYDFDTTLTSLTEDSQIEYAYGLSMTAAKYNFLYKTNHVSSTLYAGGTKSLASYNTEAYSADEWADFGSTSSFSKIPTYASDKLNIDFTTYGSTMGIPMTSNIQLYLADVVSPTLASVYIETDAYNTTSLNEKAGDTVEINLVFSEPIRTASGVAPDDTVALELQLAYNGQDYTGTAQYAYLTEVNDCTLTFEYTVPETIDGVATNHVITGIKSSGNQSFYGGDFTLNYPYNPNTYGYGEVEFLSTTSGYFSSDGAYTVGTFFTDLAGNPLNSFDAVSLNNQVGWTSTVNLDCVAPYVTGISTATSELNLVGANDVSRVYAGVGDVVKYVVTLNESVSYDEKDITITLNLLENGQNVTLDSLYTSNGSSTLYFDDLVITEGMTLESGATEIAVKYVTVNNTNVTDVCGNVMVSGDISVVSADDLYLDVTKPTVSVDEAITNSQDSTYLAIPVTISDSGSGITAMNGTYRLNVDGLVGENELFGYQVAITDSQTTPTEEQWSYEMNTSQASGSEFAFSATGQTQYFHFKITRTPSGSDFDKVYFDLSISDYAGNQATSHDEVKFTVDLNPPTIEFSEVEEDAVGDKQTLSFTATITDVNGVDVNGFEYADPTLPYRTDLYEWESDYDGWDIDTYSVNNDGTEVVLSVSKTFDASEAFTKYFALKAVDKYGNSGSNYVAISKSNDVHKIIEIVADYESFTYKPLYDDANDSDLLTGDSTLLFIEDPESSGNYLMREIYYNVDDGSGTLLNNYYLSNTTARLDMLDYDVDNWDDFGSKWWSYVTVTENGGEITGITEVGSVEKATLEMIAEGNYYGVLSGMVVVGSDMLASDIANFDGAMAIEKFSYHLTPETAYNAVGEVVSTLPDVTISAVDWNLTTAEDWDVNKDADDDGLPDALYNTTVAGKVLEIKLDGTVENWALSDIEKMTITFDNLQGDDDKTYDLAVSTLQNFTIPADAVTELADNYEIRVEVTPNYGSSGSKVSDVFMIRDVAIGDFAYEKTYHSNLLSGYGWHYVTVDYVAGSDILVGYNDDESTTKGTTAVIGTTAVDTIKEYVRVWVAGDTDEETAANRAAAVWNEASTFYNDGLGYVTGVAFNIAYTGEDTTDLSNPLVLEKDTSNVVYYEVWNETGALSSTRSVIMKTSDEVATFEMAVTPEYSGSVINSGTAYVKTLSNNTLLATENEKIMQPYLISKTGELGQVDDGEGNMVDNIYDIVEKGDFVYGVLNPYGNLSISTLNVDYVDNTAPSLELYGSGEGNFTVVYNDNYLDYPSYNSNESTTEIYDDIAIYMKYDDEEYMNRLIDNGLLVGSDGYFKLELPAQIQEGSYVETTSWSNGIYAMSTYYNRLSLYYSAFYDETQAEGATLSSSISMYAIDHGGNVSEPETFAVKIENTKPAFVSMSVDSDTRLTINDTTHYVYKPQLQFNQAVNVTSPSYKDVSDRYTSIDYGTMYAWRFGFPAYNSGTYTVEFTDIFGQEYSEDIVLDFAGTGLEDYGLTVTPLSAGIVEEKYSVHIEIEDAGNSIWLHPSANANDYPLASFVPDDGSEFVAGSPTTSGVLTFNGNGQIAVSVGDGDTWVERVITCYEIAEPAEVEVSYYYSSGSTVLEGVTYTAGDVVVTLKASDPERSIAGDMQSLSHTITYGDFVAGDVNHTFKYVDDQGFDGSYDFTLSGIVLTEPATSATPAIDDVAPVYSVKTYGKYGSGYNLLDTWVSTTWAANLETGAYEAVAAGTTDLAAALENVGYTQSLMLEVEVADESAYKVLILPYGTTTATYETVSTTVSGVTFANDFITITDENAAFAIAVVDENNNIAVISQINGGFEFDNEAPQITDTQVLASGYTGAVVYLKVEDNLSEVSVVYPTSMTKVLEGEYEGYYKYAVSANGSFDVAFCDEAKNTVVQTVTVGGIDGDAATATLSRWSPSSDDSALLPPTLTNQNVVAEVLFDKVVKDLTLTVDVDGNGYVEPTATSPVSILYNDGELATIQFTDTAKAHLTFTALNGVVNTFELDMTGVIDKIAPLVSGTTSYIYNSASGGNYSNPIGAVITVSPTAETIYIGGVEYTQSEPLVETVYANGTYTYNCYDGAGNLTVETVAISTLDEATPELTFGELPSGNVSTDLNFDVRVNEAGTFTLGSGLTTTDSLSVAATEGGSISVTVSTNGYYTVSFVDLAGRSVSKYISVGVIDKTAPTILVAKTTVQVRQETDFNELTKDFFLDNLEVRDNVSLADDITINVDMTNVTQGNLNTIGVYAVPITATDEAGNVGTYTMYIDVFSKYQTAVSVNDVNVEDNSVVTITAGEMEIDIDLPEDFDGEPYNVYLAEGYFKAGYMKSYSEKLDVVGDHIDGVATAGNWYTLYIVRQSREVFIAYIYVGQ